MATYLKTPPTVGSTVTFQLLLPLKNGVTWDISAAVVTLYLKNPVGVILTKSAVVIAGSAQYTTTTGDLDQRGLWSRTWEIVDGALTVWSQSIGFNVFQPSS